METFLHEIAQRLLEHEGSDLSRICVVFNNRRPGLFLRHWLGELGPDAFFLPKIKGMDDIIRDISELEIIQKDYLLFELYDIHRSLLAPEEAAEPFDRFISLGEMMLNDFSEIDLYLADVEQLFDNLYELKAIGEWDISGKPLTPFQQNYLRFYRSLYHHYTALRDRLLREGKAYSGLAYRMAAEHIAERQLDYDHIYFVGFNALSASEHKIISTLQRRGDATLICDGDAYYYDHPTQEAGHFLRQLAHSFSSVGGYKDHFAQGKKDITLVDSPEDLMQVKFAGELLRQLNIPRQTPDGATGDTTEARADTLGNTAIVLADENLLIPMLNSLPDTIEAVNVTMGYPLFHTAVHTLIFKIISWRKNMRGQQVHHRDFIDLLTDPCYGMLTDRAAVRHDVQRYLSNQLLGFLDLPEAQLMAQKLSVDIDPLVPLFDQDTDPEALLALGKRWIMALQGKADFMRDRKEAMATETFLQLADHLLVIQQRYRYIDNMDTLERIYTRMARRLSIPFYGEPLQGLQILGMLETRNLDFKRVILLSANEGVLPSGRKENSLIPFSLKRDTTFRLPTHEEKDAIYANHFYRLLQRAEDIYIVYSTQSESMGKGEPSRFVAQLISELVPSHPNISLHELHINPVISDNAAVDNAAAYSDKNDRAVQQLQHIGEQLGFSPSALSVYRSCPMRYYYQYILQVRESEELGDSLDDSHFGTLVHKILQRLYSPYIGALLSADAIGAMLTQADSQIEVEFARMGATFARRGRSYLHKRIAQEQIRHILENDKSTVISGSTLRIVALEQPLEQTLTLSSGITAKMIGTSDRIDEIDGRLRIVDYKTGRVNESDLSLKGELDIFRMSDKAFQVLMYSWLYVRGHQSDTACTSVTSGIFPLGNLKKTFLPLVLDSNDTIDANILQQFESQLCAMIDEIYDPKVPFRAAEEVRHCEWCPYQTVCARHFSS